MSNNSKITMNLIGKATLSTETIPSSQVIGGAGPLANMYTEDGKNIVTILAYLPDFAVEKFNPVAVAPNTQGIDLGLEGLEFKVYLNYYGVKVITTTDRNGNRQLVDCRNFVFEYNCAEDAQNFKLCYFQFEYSLEEGTNSVDSIFVTDVNDDPRGSRGTVTSPAHNDE